ncbi:hypothetical protein GVY41_06785 [Frigidibacter albus]|uniref:Fenitrothion hydrolase n=1 Tax=Frigidibacter albus TaxID=1465486 RepID=A0A6L8VFJ9_9RHOB|nr:hypothetical protein [Frigidibacter albus]MZQ88481.1 hypothetical protein [Frigidibacter albus]NBE30710.1 hypothetical protein [Frigidibacter albus]GGH48576.1 hypothetical protein GCM10011341_10340 [Frigidibacter albus]
MRQAAALAGALALLPGAALAHASERMVILTLPTGWYILGAAVAVALTGVLALMGRLPAFTARQLWQRRVIVPRPVVSWIAALVWAALVVTGLLGSRDPMANPLPLMVWTVMWVALTLACVIVGDLWRGIDPWTGPVRSARRLLGRTGGIGLARLGYLPAVLFYLAFAWFEIVSLSPADPAVLARVVAGYWLVVFVLAVAEGEDWLERGEAFTVYFGFVSKIAPLWHETHGDTVRRFAGLPGAQVLRMTPLPPTAIAFVTLVLAGVTFDGLSESFWWLARIGINPLEFPGRSAVTGVNTAGLLALWALTGATILAALALGLRLAGAPLARFGALAGPVLLSFLPIAAGYHVAHYFIALLTQGQYVLAALNDPLHRDWALLGLPEHWVSFGFLSDAAWVHAIWAVQFAVILGAHVLAVVLSMRLSDDTERLSGWSHLPVTVLMVLYTVLGLWLLSTPTGA